MAQQADGTVYIDTLLDTTGFKAGGKEVEAAVRRMSKTVSGIGETAKIALQKQTDAFVKANQAYAQQEQKVESLRQKLEEMSNQKVATDEFKEIGKQIDNDTAKLNRLEKAQEEFLAVGGKESSSAYRRRELEIEELRNSIKYAKSEQEELLNTGGAYKAVDTSSVEQKLSNEEQRLQNMNNSLATSYASLKNKVEKYGGSANNLTKIKDRLTKAFSSFLSSVKKTAKSIGGSLLSGVKKLGASMLGLGKNTKSSNNAFGGGLKTMLKYGLGIRSLFVLVNKLRSALVDGFKNLAQYDGQTNSSISSLMSALTQLKNSFATAFAPILNVVAPILTTFINMVSRAVTSIGMLVAALTGQSSFTKAVAVQEDYAASLGDTAGAADDAAKSTKKAEKATQTYLSGLDEINRYTSNDKDDSGSGSTPSALGYKAPTPGEMFETVPIESSLKNLADKIRSFFKSEDWKGLGEFAADNLNNGLKKIKDVISWDNIGPSITYFVNAFATTFNSLVNKLNWNLLGSTIASGINTVINTLNLLITSINWTMIGQSLSEGINGLVQNIDFSNLGLLLANKFMILPRVLIGFVRNLDWSLIGLQIGNSLNSVVGTIDLSLIGEMLGIGLTGIFQAAVNFAQTFDWQALGTNIYEGINNLFLNTDFETIGEAINSFVLGMLDTLVVAIEGTDWKMVGESIASALKKLDWASIAEKTFSALGEAFGGLKDLVFGIVEEAWDSVVNWWYETAFEDGDFVIQGLFNGIKDVLSNIGEWVMQNVVDPFCNAFLGEDTWSGIKEAGKNIIDGFFQGIKDFFSDPLEWIKTNIADPFISAFKNLFGINSPSTVMAELGGFLMDGLLGGIGNLVEDVTGVFTGIKDSIGTVWDSISTTASTVWDGITTTLSDVWSGLSEGAVEKFDSIKTNVENVFSNIGETASTVWGGIKDTLGGIWDWLTGKSSEDFPDMQEDVETSMSAADRATTQAWEDIEAASVENWKSSSDEVTGSIELMRLATSQELDKVVKNVESHMKSIYNHITNNWTYARKKVEIIQDDLYADTSDALEKVITLLNDDFSKRWENAWNRIRNSFVNSMNGLDRLIISPLNNVIRIVNNAINMINNAIGGIESSMSFGPWDIPTATGTRRIGFKATFPRVNSIPYLATGAVIPPNAPFAAVLGDQKRGNNIEAPEALLRKIVREELSGVQQGGNNTYTFVGQINRRTLFEEMMDEAELVRHSTGHNPFEMA